MIETIENLLEELESYCFAYDIASNTIQRVQGSDSLCLKDLLLITQKLEQLQIEYTVTSNKSIILVQKDALE